MKDCCFQYATEQRGDPVIDSGLISRADAEQMWQEHIPKFKRDVERGAIPEMAIWIDMGSDTDYCKTASHWHGAEMELRGDGLYQVTRVA